MNNLSPNKHLAVVFLFTILTITRNYDFFYSAQKVFQTANEEKQLYFFIGMMIQNFLLFGGLLYFIITLISKYRNNKQNSITTT